MARMRLTRLWVTPEFKKFAYEEKAERPDKPLHEILDEIAEDKRKRRGGKHEMPSLFR